jgi:hypothetical protein
MTIPHPSRRRRVTGNVPASSFGRVRHGTYNPGDVVQSTTLPDRPLGTVFAYGSEEDPRIAVMWHPDQERRGLRLCHEHHLEPRPDVDDPWRYGE